MGGLWVVGTRIESFSRVGGRATGAGARGPARATSSLSHLRLRRALEVSYYSLTRPRRWWSSCSRPDHDVRSTSSTRPHCPVPNEVVEIAFRLRTAGVGSFCGDAGWLDGWRAGGRVPEDLSVVGGPHASRGGEPGDRQLSVVLLVGEDDWSAPPHGADEQC